MTMTDWGGSTSTFGEDYKYDGSKIEKKFNYRTVGLSLDECLSKLKIKHKVRAFGLLQSPPVLAPINPSPILNSLKPWLYFHNKIDAKVIDIKTFTINIIFISFSV